MFEAVSSHFNAIFFVADTLSLINDIPAWVKAFVLTAAFPEEVHLNLPYVLLPRDRFSLLILTVMQWCKESYTILSRL